MWSIIRSIYAWLLLSVIVLPMFPAAWLFGRVTARRDASGDRLRVFVARG